MILGPNLITILNIFIFTYALLVNKLTIWYKL